MAWLAFKILTDGISLELKRIQCYVYWFIHVDRGGHSAFILTALCVPVSEYAATCSFGDKRLGYFLLFKHAAVNILAQVSWHKYARVSLGKCFWKYLWRTIFATSIQFSGVALLSMSGTQLKPRVTPYIQTSSLIMHLNVLAISNCCKKFLSIKHFHGPQFKENCSRVCSKEWHRWILGFVNFSFTRYRQIVFQSEWLYQLTFPPVAC